MRLLELRGLISLSSPTVCVPPYDASSTETLAADNKEDPHGMKGRGGRDTNCAATLQTKVKDGIF